MLFNVAIIPVIFGTSDMTRMGCYSIIMCTNVIAIGSVFVSSRDHYKTSGSKEIAFFLCTDMKSLTFLAFN